MATEAIQGIMQRLHQELDAKNAEITRLNAEITRLKEHYERLRAEYAASFQALHVERIAHGTSRARIKELEGALTEAHRLTEGIYAHYSAPEIERAVKSDNGSQLCIYGKALDVMRAALAKSEPKAPEPHWQKEVPKQSGLYWVADRQGRNAGTKRVVWDEGKLIYAGYPTGPGEDFWEGWWWSEPLVEPQPPPKWEES